MFGHPDISTVNINVGNVSTISDLDSEHLVQPFSMEEIKDVVFSMEHNKAPGPDGFNAEFYQYFWDLIKWDLKAMLDDFHAGRLDLARFTYGIITLVPKCKEAKQIQKFRPICLLNVSFKIFTDRKSVV